MISSEEKNLRYNELANFADKAYEDFLTDWESLCSNDTPKYLKAFAMDAKTMCIKEILNMKDIIKINKKPLSYYLEDCEHVFYEKDKMFSSMFYCIWHVSNNCVYKRGYQILNDCIHFTFKIDNANFCPWISMIMTICLLSHSLSGVKSIVDITFENTQSKDAIIGELHKLIREFKDVNDVNFYLKSTK